MLMICAIHQKSYTYYACPFIVDLISAFVFLFNSAFNWHIDIRDCFWNKFSRLAVHAESGFYYNLFQVSSLLMGQNWDYVLSTTTFYKNSFGFSHIQNWFVCCVATSEKLIDRFHLFLVFLLQWMLFWKCSYFNWLLGKGCPKFLGCRA